MTECAADYQDNDNDGVCRLSCVATSPVCVAHSTCRDDSGTVECLCDAGREFDADGACRMVYSGSCEEIVADDPLSADGDYRLYVDHAPTRAWTAYCHGMATAPTEYLTVDSNENVSHYLGGGHRPSGSTYTSYSKVRLDPLTLKVNIFDMTFATSDAGNPGVASVAYGIASNCTWEASAQSRINLTSSRFEVVEDFCLSGWYPYGSATFSAENQIVALSGGGQCGSIQPQSMCDFTGDADDPGHGWFLQLALKDCPLDPATGGCAIVTED